MTTSTGALPESGALARALLELSHEGLLLLDEGLRVRACNAALCQLLGYGQDDLLRLHLQDIRAVDRHRDSTPSLEHCLKSSGDFDGFFSFRRQDGTEIHLSCTGRVERDPLLRVLVVSPARMMGQSFVVEGEQTEQRLRMLIDQAPFAIQIFALDGTLLHVNHTWEQIWGVNGNDVIGRYNVLTDHQVAEMGLAETIARVFAGHEAGSIPAREYDPAKGGIPGRKRWIELRFFHIRDAEGRIKYVCIQNEDVTEQKEAESERRTLLDQLHHAQKLESIGQLAGGVAHDFNNLLTGIRGFVELVAENLDPRDSNQGALHEIQRATDRAASLTSQLLAFSRRQVIEPRVLVLNDVISDSANMLRRLIGEDIELHLALDERRDRVLIDPHQIDQILMNLASNGRDAMPHGGTLFVETSRATLDEEYCRTRPDASPGEHVLLVVSDTGEGMPPEARERAFEPFFSTKEQGQGTGLGLATVYGIVKQNNGRIELYSEPDVGTTVRIYLPRTDAAVTPAKRPSRFRSAGDETILLVEDEQVVRALVDRVLSSRGYTVLVAEHPARALQLAAAHEGPIHLLLTDVVMPKMNGRELYEQLHAARPRMGVLFVSGYSENVIVRQGMVEESFPFLSKPFSTKALLQRVREALDTP